MKNTNQTTNKLLMAYYHDLQSLLIYVTADYHRTKRAYPSFARSLGDRISHIHNMLYKLEQVLFDQP